MKILAFTILLLCVSNAALASTTGSVGSASVTKGRTQLETRFGFSEADESSSQDERFRSRFQIDHGVTDWYAARVVLQQDKRKGDSFEHDSLTFENRVQFLDKKEHGFDLGARAGYQHKDGDKTPSALTFGAFGLFPVQEYELRINQLFSHDVGEDADDGLGAEFRFQVTRPITDHHRFGIEGFHDFGNLQQQAGYSEQSHTFGPVFKGNLPFAALKYEAGYRVGVSEAAPDHSVKLFINRAF